MRPRPRCGRPIKARRPGLPLPSWRRLVLIRSRRTVAERGENPGRRGHHNCTYKATLRVTSMQDDVTLIPFAVKNIWARLWRKPDKQQSAQIYCLAHARATKHSHQKFPLLASGCNNYVLGTAHQAAPNPLHWRRARLRPGAPGQCMLGRCCSDQRQ